MLKAIVLLSGGLDSATCLYWAKSKGYQPLALLFDYGQKHSKEIQQAVQIARQVRVPYKIVKFILPWLGSSLLDSKISVPTQRTLRQMSEKKLPSTYVPARNTLFLSFALSYADAMSASAIVIGANAIDYSGYPDCRPNYIAAMQTVAILGTKSGNENKKIKILAPLIHMSKAQIIQLGLKLKVPYHLTWSCYQGKQKPCGVCDSCILREKGFETLQIKDPSKK